MMIDCQAIESFPAYAFPLFAFILGSIIGSFLNVCIYRIPLNKSIISPRSQCCQCGNTIPAHHNIPILSWILLRGKSHCCGQRFSVRYPCIEFLTGLLFALAWIRLDVVHATLGMIFFSILICSAFIDIDHKIIPDRFTIGGFILGVLLALLFPTIHQTEISGLVLLDSIYSGILALLGGIIGSGLLLWIALVTEIFLQKESMGFGDIKMMGCIGAFCGWQGAIFSIFVGALIGCIGIISLTLIKNFFSQKNPNEKAPIFGVEVSFGPYLALASLLYYLFFRHSVDPYMLSIQDLFSI